MADRNGYIGRAPGDSSVVVARQVFSPTGIQTNFTFSSGYTVGYLDTYLNGVRLIEGQDYTATNGSVVGLTTHAESGDVIECVAYKAFNVATIDSAAGGFTVGSNLSVGGYISAGGSITGSAFYGDGSNLTGISSVSFATTTFSLADNATGSNAVLTGILTASNFSGNLTGNVTGNVTGNATGLSGSPSIIVTNVSAQDVQVGGAITITGNLTVNGTQTIVNTTNLEITDPLIGIGSGNTTDVQADGDGIQIYGATNKTLTYNNTKKAFETNIPIATNETRLITGAEKTLRVDGNTVDLNYNNSSGSNIGIATNPSGDVTLNVVNIPTDASFDDHSITFVVVVNSTGTARTCTAVTLNGVSKTIKWSGGSLGEAIAGVTTTNGYSFFNFTGINTVGSASTTDNYEVFGIVSGGFY